MRGRNHKIVPGEIEAETREKKYGKFTKELKIQEEILRRHHEIIQAENTKIKEEIRKIIKEEVEKTIANERKE